MKVSVAVHIAYFFAVTKLHYPHITDVDAVSLYYSSFELVADAAIDAALEGNVRIALALQAQAHILIATGMSSPGDAAHKREIEMTRIISALCK